MTLPELLGCFALMLLGFSLLQLDTIFYRKIGMGSLWLASGLTAYFLSGSVSLACAVLAAWIFFPLWEMVFVLRQLRVPRHRELADARAPRDEFEELSGMTQALVEAGFEQLDECRLRPADHEQYYRIFVWKDGLTQATIGYIAQGAIGFHFVAFTSNGKDGRRWVTWDYPLTYGLVMPPGTSVYRALHCQDVAELYQAHLNFLEINEVHPDDLVAGERTREAARTRLEETLNQQVEYNISRGYLAPVKGPDEENFCYSWRGTLYVAGQVLRDLLF
ncbi:MAG TPA: hypothetical protein VGZ93_09155 [Candidatus Methylacidiphilales bacterium]|jgi:hypothetical protein|nr:hypothetical protein [Candidatus Methylacidiphilales bacterium]